MKKNDLGFPRFAFIISKKFSKKAIERNRVKRIIKEALRLNFHRLKNLNYDIVVIPKKHLINKKTQDLMEDISNLQEILRAFDEKNTNTAN